ncbi:MULTISPECIES: hypothetical protein [Actinomadura]|uniref:Uncharacterized protein n=1 Tax=Actinomadura litoris TaxID=2678616 RepID=A0A7K1L2J4_9ACTN|nr:MULTISPECIES: hypothetical protein [Actinomadura]MBT2208833.1 hypothetical protein [Actinomadura sp. NEAU-AAG7]MUN38607.1 hypothetical protein [Actinomadura litoris]
MPAHQRVIAAHAEALDADAEALTGCAARLHALAARLRSDAAAPPWLFDTLNAHITACVVASADLAEVATRLHVYADLLGDEEH